MFSTEMPYTDIYALEASLSVISSARGQEVLYEPMLSLDAPADPEVLFPIIGASKKLRERLYRLCDYAREKLFTSLKNVPETILAVDKHDTTAAFSDPGLCSPVIPVFSLGARRLADYLIEKGYAATAVSYSAVKRSRIRITIHAGNKEEEIDSFINELLAWTEQQGRVSLTTGSAIGSEGVGLPYSVASAKL